MSNLSIFKISIGPSSSHTLGPLLIGNLFCKDIAGILMQVTRLRITLFGSLSFTGRGHLTDNAILWGLANLRPETITYTEQDAVILRVKQHSRLCLGGIKDICFSEEDLVFSEQFLPMHPNALTIHIWAENGDSLGEYTYYSVGGGFIMDEQSLAFASSSNKLKITTDEHKVREFWELRYAKEALVKAGEKNWNLWELSWNYELQFNSAEYIRQYCLYILNLMQTTYYNGVNSEASTLPGVLRLKRRARSLAATLQESSDPLGVLDYISLYAMAVSEENASGMRVVAAPTNGACAVVPAVMLYLKNHTANFGDEHAIQFLLSAMLIGGFYKKNASISGADAGCQAEIGSASSMAAGAMATVLGATIDIAFSAAEIAMEHHLGMTCDPVAGLVQIPCIERNAFGAIKAISAVRMAIRRESEPTVSLDDVIKTMYQTGKDMHVKYKETSLGGLASTLSNLC